MLTLNNKFNVVTLDIETEHAPESAIKKRQMNIQRDEPNPRLRKPEKIQDNMDKIERDYQTALQRVVEKSALLNAAPIGCISVVADTLLLHFSTFTFSAQEQDALQKEGIIARTCPDKKMMLQEFVQVIENFCDYETRLVGFNSWKFDFPKLRLACRRNNVPLPFLLKPVNRSLTIDVMEKFVRFYNCENGHQKFISLKQVCEELHIPYHKGLTGAEIPDAIKRGDVLQVTLDSMHDAIETHQAFLKL